MLIHSSCESGSLPRR